ncbi:MAG: hypothetical protein M3R04_02655 [bacterium]|nr:hypothetical protein [bacterium]
MRLSGSSRFYFFVAWIAWWVAAWSLIYAEYLLRSRDMLTQFAVEAWFTMVAPLAVFAIADQLVMRIYERVWFDFTERSLGPLVLEREAVDRLRSSLRRNLLLRWAAPPESRSIGAQLMTAALWLPALSAPDDTPTLKRYREWLIDSACWGLLGCAAVVAFIWPSRGGFAAALIVLATGLIVLGYSLVRLAARRQAILDYFSAWRSPESD